MWFAPAGVFGAVAAAITVQGLGILATYGKFIGSFYAALLVLWMVLIGAGFVVLGPRIFHLLGLIKEPLLVAFTTASSEAAYPKLMEQLHKSGVNDRVTSFVLPLGYSFNLDGSMLYQAFAALFIAQAYGIDLSFGQQLTLLLVMMVSSKGIAGVPRASLVVVAAVLPTFGLPEAGLLLIMGIDQFLDMGRTATNVIGNSIATSVVAKWEGQLGEPVRKPATPVPRRLLPDANTMGRNPMRPALKSVAAASIRAWACAGLIVLGVLLARQRRQRSGRRARRPDADRRAQAHQVLGRGTHRLPGRGGAVLLRGPGGPATRLLDRPVRGHRRRHRRRDRRLVAAHRVPAGDAGRPHRPGGRRPGRPRMRRQHEHGRAAHARRLFSADLCFGHAAAGPARRRRAFAAGACGPAGRRRARHDQRGRDSPVRRPARFRFHCARSRRPCAGAGMACRRPGRRTGRGRHPDRRPPRRKRPSAAVRGRRRTLVLRALRNHVRAGRCAARRSRRCDLSPART